MQTRIPGKCTALLAALAVGLAVLLALGRSPEATSAMTPQFRFPATSERSLDALSAKALRRGSIPVIVAFDAKTYAPQSLSSAERRAQRTLIASTRADLLGDLGGRRLPNLKTSNLMPLIAFTATPEQIERLRRSNRVVSVTEDREIALDVVPPRGKQLRGQTRGPDAAAASAGTNAGVAATTSNGSDNQLSQWWDYYRLGLDTTRNNGWTGAGQTVAVLDTGVDRNHAWLSGRVVNEACFSTRTIGYTAGDCPNGTNRQSGTGAAAPCSFDTLCAHGTHVAHTAAGTWGVAPGAKVIAVQIFHRGGNGKPTYYESDLTWALSHVYALRGAYRIAAVNMSIGGLLSNQYFAGGYCDNQSGDGTANATYITGWINNLKAAGIATVVSSGNDDNAFGLRTPACISNAVSVGNTTLDAAGNDAVFGYVPGAGSNSNSTLDLLAPGTDICSAVPTWLDDDRDGVDCRWIGTSMAAPHVAGAFAVLRQFRPASTVDQVYNALRLSGPNVTDSRNNYYTPRINVWNALYKV
jgi:subtilisin family serine protease